MTSHVNGLVTPCGVIDLGQLLGDGLSPVRLQVLVWSNAVLLFIRNLGTIFSKIQTFHLKEMQLKMSSAKWQPSFTGNLTVMAKSLFSLITKKAPKVIITSPLWGFPSQRPEMRKAFLCYDVFITDFCAVKKRIINHNENSRGPILLTWINSNPRME